MPEHRDYPFTKKVAEHYNKLETHSPRKRYEVQGGKTADATRRQQ